MTSANGTEFEFGVRIETAGMRRLYPKVRDALLGYGYQLTDTVAVMRVLERLVATSIGRDAKRLRVRVRVAGDGTRVEVIDPRRLNPRDSLSSEIVSGEVARASGADRLGGSGGLVLWAVVDRPAGPDASPAV